MKLSHVLSTTALAALLLGAPGLPLAQHDAADLSEVDDDDRIVEPFQLSADRIDDMDVMTADGDRIGEIEEVLMDRSGELVAVAVEVDDLLDLDDEERIVGLERMRLENDRFATDLSEDEIRALPVWDD